MNIGIPLIPGVASASYHLAASEISSGLWGASFDQTHNPPRRRCADAEGDPGLGDRVVPGSYRKGRMRVCRLVRGCCHEHPGWQAETGGLDGQVNGGAVPADSPIREWA